MAEKCPRCGEISLTIASLLGGTAEPHPIPEEQEIAVCENCGRQFKRTPGEEQWVYSGTFSKGNEDRH